MTYTDVAQSRKNQKAEKMINKRRLATVLVSSGLAVSSPGLAGAQDATFACKVLLCGQANWPTIPYCVPIMQQALWMQMLGVAVGICQQAIQQAQQQQPAQNAAQSPLATNTSNGSTSSLLCPSGSFPVSQATGGYTINSAGSMCGMPTSAAVRSVVASQCSSYTDGTCSVLFSPADLTITNPPAPAQSGVVAGQ
jgi:hypothetical protein